MKKIITILFIVLMMGCDLTGAPELFLIGKWKESNITIEFDVFNELTLRSGNREATFEYKVQDDIVYILDESTDRFRIGWIIEDITLDKLSLSYSGNNEVMEYVRVYE